MSGTISTACHTAYLASPPPRLGTTAPDTLLMDALIHYALTACLGGFTSTHKSLLSPHQTGQFLGFIIVMLKQGRVPHPHTEARGNPISYTPA